MIPHLADGMYFLPQLAPKTLEQLNWKSDSEFFLKQQEEAFENNMKLVREYLKNTTVIGQEPATPEDTDADDDELTDDETEEEGSDPDLEEDA